MPVCNLLKLQHRLSLEDYRHRKSDVVLHKAMAVRSLATKSASKHALAQHADSFHSLMLTEDH
jgi:hypothetical protein